MTIELPARIAFLKKIHLFHGLEEDDLAAIAGELDEVPYSAGSVIFAQDGKADNFYLIYGGSVRIVRKQQGKEFELARLVKGDYFGEMALIAKRRRSATVTALTDTLVLVLSRADFEKLYKQKPRLQLNLTVAIRSRQLARRLRFKWLRPNEVVYFLARKHPAILVQNLILPVLTLSLPFGLFYGWFAIAHFLIVLIAAIASLFAVLGWIAWRAVDWGNDYYIVTNQRVVWLEKVVGIYDSRQESPLSTVLSVGIESTPFQRALDYGDVIVRTFVGRIPFNHVNHPNQAARMVEEYWLRTREAAAGTEKEAMKDAIRERLGIPVAAKPKVEAVSTVSSVPKRINWLRLLGSDTLKLRYETGDNVIYRKHWFVLVEQAWMPLAGIFAAFVLFIWRLVRLAQLPKEAFIQIVNGKLTVDAFSLANLIALVPLFGWLIYQVVDWSNDKFEVTPEQIIDIDREPFGTEKRSAAQLENILGTEYKRIGILGNLFNFGTVYITVGGTKLAFEDVMDPASVQSDIDRRRAARIEKKAQAGVAAERERMAEWLVT
ncbi:MAG TPA: cyclic nucleotide-binding domain-containing protein, partial [Anaerolineales bacterium]|nr:cyclic nucleotide-binding domain-containing protein [Anaerolineales bacterium]